MTDCPTCGRTIRVPKLDGTVDPLPPPTLNTGDTELARALDQLASLAEATPGVAVEQLPPAARPVPVALADAPAAQAIDAPPTPNTGTETDHHPGRSPTTPAAPQFRSSDPLAELAALPIQPANAKKRPIRFIPWALLIGTGVGLLLGFAAGRFTSTPSAPGHELEHIPQAVAPDPLTSNPPEKGIAPPLIPHQEGQPSIEGRVTYIHTSGESRPDQGARVLVIPLRRTGTTKLPATGFRIGADDTDFRISQAAIRVLGGDFAIVDGQGHYQIRLSGRGKYHLIIVSRYQGRPADGVENLAASSALKDWLDQPRTFFGQTRSVIAEIEVDGEHPTVRDHIFPASE